jgi:hypothetical protein
METPAHVRVTLSASATQHARTEQLSRAFQRTLNRRPTEIERTAMRRAALLTARAESAALDASTSLEDIVRLDRLAAQARKAMFAVIGEPVPRSRAPKEPKPFDTLAWLREKEREAGVL